jgi:hypothetical protein
MVLIEKSNSANYAMVAKPHPSQVGFSFAPLARFARLKKIFPLPLVSNNSLFFSFEPFRIMVKRLSITLNIETEFLTVI